MDDLQHCPFCCGKPFLIEGFRGGKESKDRIAFYECQGCGAQGEKFAGIDCKEKAIDAWNKRDHEACL